MQKAPRVLVVGATAAGPKTACRLKRLLPAARITVLEKGQDISYGACGMPYFIEGITRRIDSLCETPLGVPRDPKFFAAVKGVEVRKGHEVVSIDRAAKEVEVRDAAGAAPFRMPYDKLVLSTGARPARPPIPGIDLPGVQAFHALGDAARLDAVLREREVRHAVVVGAGLIGLEMAEALAARRCRVTLVERGEWIMPALLDEEVGRLAGKSLVAEGVELLLGTEVEEFVADASGDLCAVRIAGVEHEAQVAIVAVGVRPNDELAVAAGLEVSPRGGILVDEFGRTSDPDVYAGGDCVVARGAHPVVDAPLFAPQGSTANKAGRLIANHIAGRPEPFAGVLGTVVCRAFDYTIARTGLSEAQARDRGLDVATALVPGFDRPHFMGDAASLVIKLVVDRRDRRLLGGQIVGPGDASKRLDVLATALSFGATIDQLAHLDLGYAPPFSPPLDPLLVAAHVLQNQLDGIARGVSPLEAKGMIERGEVTAVDVRGPDEFVVRGLPYDVRHLPLGALRERGAELPRDRPLLVFCQVSLRGYEAQRILQGLGFEDVAYIEGGLAGWPFALRED